MSDGHLSCGLTGYSYCDTAKREGGGGAHHALSFAQGRGNIFVGRVMWTHSLLFRGPRLCSPQENGAPEEALP